MLILLFYRYKFHCSKWCNDGTEPPKENNNQEMAWIYDC